MLQAHSLLWHYLWIAPNLLLLVLVSVLWLSRSRQFPVFMAFAVLGACGQLAVYAADVAPFVTAKNFWQVYWANLLTEGLLKFALIGEIFGQVFDLYPSVAKLGKVMIRGVGVLLVLVAAIAAAYAPKDSPYGLINGAHLLEQTIYLIESGLLLFIFLFSAYFQLRPTRPVFGIAIGLAVSACVHLATWAVAANVGLPASRRVILDFLNMATYHACVLIWFYYLLVPQRVVTKSAVSLPENNLAVWNRELEHLLHQ